MKTTRAAILAAFTFVFALLVGCQLTPTTALGKRKPNITSHAGC